MQNSKIVLPFNLILKFIQLTIIKYKNVEI